MIDWTKPVQTRDGRSVRILCTDGCVNEWPIVGYIGKDVMPTAWRPSGSVGQPTAKYSGDLINVPEKRVAWVNIYANQSPTRQHADDVGHSSRIACIRVEYEVGQFDEDEI